MRSKITIIIAAITLSALISGLIVAMINIQHGQQTRTKAEANTVTLSWSPSPLTLALNESKEVALKASAPSLSIGAVQVKLRFDPPEAASLVEVVNVTSSLFPSVLHNLETAGGNVQFALGTTLQTATGQNIEVARVSIRAKQNGTLRLVDAGSLVSAVNQSNTNVLADNGFSPLTVTIRETTGELTPGPSTNPTSGVLTPTPTGNASANSTITPTTPAANPSPTSTAAATVPNCTSLSVQPATGNAPLVVNFRGEGNIASPGNIDAAEFSFAEGSPQLIQKNYGASASETTTHSYANAGSYQVFVRFRSAAGLWSSIPTACTGQVMVIQAVGGNSQTHYACRGGSCVATAGVGANECSPAENSCKSVQTPNRLPKSGSIRPGVIVGILGALLITLSLAL